MELILGDHGGPRHDDDDGESRQPTSLVHGGRGSWSWRTWTGSILGGRGGHFDGESRTPTSLVHGGGGSVATSWLEELLVQVSQSEKV